MYLPSVNVRGRQGLTCTVYMLQYVMQKTTMFVSKENDGEQILMNLIFVLLHIGCSLNKALF